MKKSNVKINPIIVQHIYKLDQIHRYDHNIKLKALIPFRVNMFRPQLESWICKQICGKDNTMLVESIKLVHKLEILNISDYMMAKLSGNVVNGDQLKECFIEALVELNLDIKELRKIDKQKLAKIKNSKLYKRK